MPTPLDPTRPVRWGILGAGWIADKVGPAIVGSPDSELAAIGSRSRDRAAALATAAGAPAARIHDSYDELVPDPDIDVVYVATPHAQHHEHALLALRAGKPALVQKAFTLTAREAHEVLDEARARDLFCMEAMWMRVNPLVLQAQQLVADGALGELLSVTADHGQSFPLDPKSRLFAMESRPPPRRPRSWAPPAGCGSSSLSTTRRAWSSTLHRTVNGSSRMTTVRTRTVRR